MNMRTAPLALLLVATFACGDTATVVQLPPTTAVSGTPGLTPQTGMSPSDKMSVCHTDDFNVWRLLRVSESALTAHLNHGDGLPGDLVPGSNGRQLFDDDCVLVGWEILVSEVASNRIKQISPDGAASLFVEILSPRGIAAEPDGSLIIVDQSGKLWRVAPDGSLADDFFTEPLYGPSGVAIMDDGDLVVTEDHGPYFRLLRVAPDGSEWSVIAEGVKSEDVEVDQDGNLIAAQELGDPSLVKVTPTSGSITTLYADVVSPSISRSIKTAASLSQTMVQAKWSNSLPTAAGQCWPTG